MNASTGAKLGQLLAAAMSGGDGENEEAGPALTTTEMVERLQAAAARYGTQPYKAGDLVTPRADSELKNVGQPYVVLEVLKEPFYCFHGGDQVGPNIDSTFGARLDMRVAKLCSHGHVKPWWVESYEFEPWVAPQQPQRVPITPETPVARQAEPATA